MMIKKISLFFFCLFCCVGIAFAEKNDNSTNSLTKLHKEQLKVYAMMQMSMIKEPNKTEQFVKDYFELIVTEVVEVYPTYVKYTKNLKKRSDDLLLAGKVKSAEKYAKIIPYYSNMEKACKLMIQNFKNYNKSKLNEGINLYLTNEIEMKKLKLKIADRKWFSPQEIRAIMIPYLQAKKGNRKDNDKKEEK